jgi:hypothetical protein
MWRICSWNSIALVWREYCPRNQKLMLLLTQFVHMYIVPYFGCFGHYSCQLFKFASFSPAGCCRASDLCTDTYLNCLQKNSMVVPVFIVKDRKIDTGRVHTTALPWCIPNLVTRYFHFNVDERDAACYSN